MPTAICATGKRRPAICRPASEPPITNSDSAALACANSVTVRASGEGICHCSADTTKPASRPSTMGLRARFSSDWRNTVCQRPPLPALLSASASSSGISNRFSTIMFRPSITPATGPITSSAIGKPTKPLFGHDMPIAQNTLVVGS